MIYNSFSEVIDAVAATFPRPRQQNLAAVIGVQGVTISAWKSDDRNFIPSEYWPDIVAMARLRGVPGITNDVLSDLAKARKRPEAA